jgi:hypothetical protein
LISKDNVLNDVEFGDTSNFSGTVNCNFISDAVISFAKSYSKNNFVQGLFDIFSVNRKDSLFQLLANVHLDKHVNWVGNCKNNSISNCYFCTM